MDTGGTDQMKITSGAGDKTDPSFSPDGKWIVYSLSNSRMRFANLSIIPASGGSPIRLTDYEGYDGAPSWSYDEKKIVFEFSPGEPDGSSGTTLWTINAPNIANEE